MKQYPGWFMDDCKHTFALFNIMNSHGIASCSSGQCQKYIMFDTCFLWWQAGELDILSAVLKWGEHQLIRRMEERG